MTETKSGQVLVVEDEAPNRDAMKRALDRAGYRVNAFGGVEEALDYLRHNDDVLVIVTDLKMPGKDGFDLLREAKVINPRVGILMITAHGSIDLAVEAMKEGAEDFLTKPVDIFELRKRVGTLTEKRRLEQEVRELRNRIGELQSFGNLIGKSEGMQKLYRQLEMVAPTRSTVLIIGESGTGKELVANAIHENSPRREQRFLPINCGAIPAEILESELFGHEKGAFTGASARKFGKFELADKGTLFLDEIGELPPEMQVKLLRVLEEQEFMRVGGTSTVRVDVRILAATNRDLELAVNEKRFRSDLYYRLKVVIVNIPPLRERKTDIAMLADHLLAHSCREHEKAPMRIADETMRLLTNHPWTGNVRELRNVLESMVIFSSGDVLEPGDLPPELREAAPETPAGSVAEVISPTGSGVTSMDEIERRAILQALEETSGNRTQAAEKLGIGLRTLQRKLKEYKERGLYRE